MSKVFVLGAALLVAAGANAQEVALSFTAAQAQPLAAELSMALAAPSWPEYDEGDGHRDSPTDEDEGERREEFQGY